MASLGRAWVALGALAMEVTHPPVLPYFLCRKIKKSWRAPYVIVEEIKDESDLLFGIEELETNEYGYSEWLHAVLLDSRGRPLQAEVDIVRGISEVKVGTLGLNAEGMKLLNSACECGLWPPEGLQEAMSDA